MYLYVPHNLDLESMVKENPPPFKRFKIDKAYYIIHLINYVKSRKKDRQYEEYTPLKASTLQKVISNYKDYVIYLKDNLNIIERNEHYIPTVQAKGYKLVKEYNTYVKPIKAKDFTLIRNYSKLKKNDLKTVEHLPYLTKWFNNKLKIDSEIAKNYIQEVLELKMHDDSLRDVKTIRKKNKRPVLGTKTPHTQYINSHLSVLRIENKDYHMKQDNNVFRFHSNLSIMPSVLRNALTYANKKLSSVDVKNSQPFLCLLLLNLQFWLGDASDWLGDASEKTLQKIYQNTELQNIKEDNSFNFKEIQNENKQIVTYHKLRNKHEFRQQVSYTMILKAIQSIDNEEYRLFKDMVTSGRFYEEFGELLFQDTGVHFDRKDIKTMMFQVLFTDNRYAGINAPEKELFKKIFPAINRVLEAIKIKDKEALPCLLQRIESHIIIDITCKRLSKEIPYDPLYTIHDSIASTIENVSLIENIMKEELTKAVGFAPTLDVEFWNKEAMDKELEKLKQKTSNAKVA